MKTKKKFGKNVQSLQLISAHRRFQGLLPTLFNLVEAGQAAFHHLDHPPFPDLPQRHSQGPLPPHRRSATSHKGHLDSREVNPLKTCACSRTLQLTSANLEVQAARSALSTPYKEAALTIQRMDPQTAISFVLAHRDSAFVVNLLLVFGCPKSKFVELPKMC